MVKTYNLRRDELFHFVNKFPETIHYKEVNDRLEWGVLNNLNRIFIKKLKTNYIGSQPIQIQLSEIEFDNLTLYLKHCPKILIEDPKVTRALKELTKS